MWVLCVRAVLCEDSLNFKNNSIASTDSAQTTCTFSSVAWQYWSNRDSFWEQGDNNFLQILPDAIHSSGISLNILKRLIWAVRHGGGNHLYGSVTRIFPFYRRNQWDLVTVDWQYFLVSIVSGKLLSEIRSSHGIQWRTRLTGHGSLLGRVSMSNSGNWVVAESWVLHLRYIDDSKLLTLYRLTFSFTNEVPSKPTYRQQNHHPVLTKLVKSWHPKADFWVII